MVYDILTAPEQVKLIRQMVIDELVQALSRPPDRSLAAFRHRATRRHMRLLPGEARARRIARRMQRRLFRQLAQQLKVATAKP